MLTAAVLLLSIVGAFSFQGLGSDDGSSKFGWELAVQGRVSMPFEIAGVEAQPTLNDTLTGTWEALMSQSFGG